VHRCCAFTFALAGLFLYDLLPFVFAIFMIFVCKFFHGDVSVKVGIMEFGLYWVCR